jgi:uncharacterized protein (AIM24 family)
MQTPPQLLPTQVQEGQAPGIRYRIDGELVPALHAWLDGSVPIFFEHHVVLWKDPGLDIGIRAMKGAFKRMVAGMPIFLTEARGPGEIAFSRDGVGHVFPLHLSPGTAILVREHQFLAATGNLDYTFSRVKGVSNMLFASTGFFVDRFMAGSQEGVLFLHGYGNVFEKTLAPNEQIDVEPGGWIYRDESVLMDVQVFGLKTGLLGGGGKMIWNRFTGPGRVGVQTMYLHLPTSD